MSNLFLKYSDEYHPVLSIRKKGALNWSEKLIPTNVYVKRNGAWVTTNNAEIKTSYYFGGWVRTTPEVNVLEIICEEEYEGISFFCISTLNGVEVAGTWTMFSGSQYASINQYGKVTINEGVVSQDIVIKCVYNNIEAFATVTVSYDNQLVIECPDEIIGTQGNVIARYNLNVVNPTWSITSGNAYATIDNDGIITVISNGDIEIQASYNGYTTRKTISLSYILDKETEISVDENGSVITSYVTVTEHQDGSVTTETTSEITNADGSRVNSESETTVYQDGSSTNTTMNYDLSGDPIDGSNNHTDTQGNSNTQEFVYENGVQVVTGYTIDTSNNPSGTGEHIAAEEINTDYYAFDTTRAFELMIHFRFVGSEQTVSQATILNAKRADPEPWYGFDLRRNGTTNNIQYGAQFTTGSNNRANITIPSNNIYKIRVNYDPTVPEGDTTFIMYDMIKNKNLFTSKLRFPDLEELKYLKITIGCALTAEGQPQRRANIDVYEFYVRRL